MLFGSLPIYLDLCSCSNLPCFALFNSGIVSQGLAAWSEGGPEDFGFVSALHDMSTPTLPSRLAPVSGGSSVRSLHTLAFPVDSCRSKLFCRNVSFVTFLPINGNLWEVLAQWLHWLSAVPYTKRLGVQFPIRALVQVLGSIPGQGSRNIWEATH